MIKTVLVPGAPWPPKDAKVIAKRKVPTETDLNFESWVQKQKQNINFDFLKGNNVIRKH